jgi:hypothetical protein
LPDKCEALSSNLVPTKNILFKNTSKKWLALPRALTGIH